MARRTWFSIFRTLFGGISGNQTKQAQRPNLLLEQMEDRTTPAVSAWMSGSEMIIQFNSANDSADLITNGSTIDVFSPFPTNLLSVSPGSVTKITVLDSGTNSGQSLNIYGNTTYNLSNGFSSSGIESIYVGDSINTTGGSAGISISASAGATISAINDGASAVVLAGGSGGVSLSTGSLTLDGSVTSASGGAISLTADNIAINTSSGSVNSGSATTTIQTTNSGTAINLGGADVLGSTLGLTDAELDRVTAGTINIGNSSSGAVTVSSAINPAGTSNLGVTTGSTIAINAGLTVSNNLSLSSNGAISQSAALSVGGTTTLAAGSGNNITLNGVSNSFSTVTAASGGTVQLYDSSSGLTVGGISASGDIVLFGTGTVSATGNLSAAGNIILRGTAASSTIGIGSSATGNVVYDASVLGKLADGATGVLIGAPTQTGAVTVSNAVSFSDPVTIRSTGTGGSITVNAGITGTGNASVTLSASPTTIYLNSSIVTAGQAITLDNGSGGATAVVLGADVTLDTTNSGGVSTGAAITVRGTVDSDSTARDLSLNGGSTGAVLVTGVVGGGSPLDVLTVTNSGGATFSGAIDANTVTLTNTTGTVTFNGSVTATTLSTAAQGYGVALNGGAAITNAVTFSNTGSVTLGASGTTSTFTGGVTATAPTSVSLGGTISTSSAAISIGDSGTPVTLNADTTLSSGSANITLGGTVDGPYGLTLNSTGTATLSAAVGGANALTSITTNAGGTTALNGGSVKTSGAQTYNDAVTIGTGTTLTSTGSGNITLGSTVNGAQTLAINTAGATTFSDVVGGTTALTSITTDAGGTTAINGGSVKSTGLQSYGDAVTLGANTTLESSGSGDITLGDTVNGAKTLAINTAGATTFSGIVGGLTPLASITTDAPGTVAINTTAITTDGDQTYNEVATLGANATLTTNNNGSVSFSDTLNGNQQLVINANGSGNVSFGGAVGGSTALNGLTIQSAQDVTAVGLKATGLNIFATGTTTFNGPVVTTVGTAAVASSVVSVNDTIGSAGNVSLQAYSGQLTIAAVADIVAAGTVYLDGAQGTSTAGDVTSDGGAINFVNAVTLTGNITVASTGSGSTGGANISFSGDINADNVANNRTLTLDAGTAGAISVTGAVGTGTNGALDTLTITNSGGATFKGAVNAATVAITDTSDGQTVAFQDNLTVGTGMTVAANGAYNVSITGSSNTIAGATTFGNTGTVTLGVAAGDTTAFTGGVDAAASSQVNIAGAISSTNSAINLSDANTPVVLGDNTSISSGNGNITLGGTVNGAFSLDLNSTGTTTLGGAVGGTNALTSITTNSNGTTNIDGGAVTTTGNQTYNDAVSLGNNAILTSSGNGNITFGGTVNGAKSLTVNTSGNTIFGNAVGNTTELTSLTTDAGGTTAINAGTVNTSLAQTYNDAVTLGVDNTLTSSGSGDITLASTVDNAKNLTINTAGATIFGGIVGGGTPLASITTDAPGTVQINTTNITTSGNQTYNENAATLGASPTLQTTGGGNITFGGSIDSSGGTRNLNLDSGSTGTISVTGAVGSSSPLGSLIINNSGGATFQSSVNATNLVSIGGTTSGQTVEFQGNLTTGSLVTSPGGYNVAIKGSNNTIGGATTFNNTGDVTIGDQSTDITLFTNGVDVISAGRTGNTLTAGFIRTAGATAHLDQVSLLANTTVDTTNNGANPAGATISVTNGLMLNTYTFNTIGGTSGSTNITGNTTINTGELVVSSGNLNLGDGTSATIAVSQNTEIKVTTGELTLTNNTTLAAGTNNITLQADTINFSGGTVTRTAGASNTLTLSPVSPTRDIYVGSAASTPLPGLKIPQPTIDAIDAGMIVIGQAGQSGLVMIGVTNLTDAFEVIGNGGGGKIQVTGTITSTYAGAGIGVYLIGSGSTTVLSADIVTAGTPIEILDAVQVNAGTVTLNTTSGGVTAGANVLITGGTSGIFATSGATNNLVVNAGTGGTALLGSLRGFGDGGGTGSLVNNLTVDASAISLPTANQLANTVDLEATNISLGADLTAGATTAGGTLTLTGAVALTSSVVLAGDGITITGGVAGNNNNLTLDGNGGASGANGAVSVTGAMSNISGLNVQDAAGATFVAVTAQTVQLANTNTGTVSFTGNLTVAGQFAAATGSTYNLEIIGTTNSIGGPVSFINTGSLTLGNDNTDSTTIGSGVSRSAQTLLQGTVNFGGATTLGSAEATNASGNLTLSADSLSLTHNGGNAFGAISITTTNTTVFAGGTLAATTLGVNAGSISQTGGAILAPTGTTTLSATGTIALAGANTFGDTVTFSGTNVTINDTTQLTLAGTNSATGNLVLSSANGISQTGGTIAVTGSSTLSSTGKDISLNQAGNAFTGPVGFTGANVALQTSGALALAASTATGTLDATANGLISQTGPLSVTGATTLAAGAANSINLSDAANSFSSVGVTSGNNVAITDTGALALNASTVSGTLDVVTTGAITDNGALSVTGAATFAAGAANDITLNNANNFSSVGITSANNVVLNDTSALALNASTISGTLDVTTAGAITDNGVLNVTGAATFAAGSGNDITLDSANNFSSVGITSGNNVAITDTGDLALNASTVSGSLAVNTTGNITQNAAISVGTTTSVSGANITLANAGNTFTGDVGFTGTNVSLRDSGALGVSASSATGTLALQAGGDVTQSGALTVGGDATVTATGFDITLANAANSFGGTVGFSGATVSLRDSTALAVAASTATGDLTLQSDGAITQTGPLTVTGNTTATATGDITLNNAGNAYTGTVGGSGANIAITDNTALSLAATTATGTLTAVSNGAITQTGAISTGGLASFTAGAANDITLTTAGNAMASVGIVSGNNVSITEADGIVLATSAVTGNLTLDAQGGAISQSGTLSVGGTSSLTATGDINLAGSSAFTGDVTFNGGANVSINDIKSNLNIGAGSSATGNLSIISAGVITDGGSLTVGGNAAFTGTSATLDGLAVTGTVGVNVTGNATLVNATALALAASSVGGNLAATATTGNLTDSGVVSVSGNASFTTSASGADITLDQTTIAGTTQFNTTGTNGDASFTTTVPVSLNGSTVGGALTISTTGNIVQTAAVTVGGTTTLTGTGIALPDAGNTFTGDVGFTGTSVTLADSGALNLVASSASGAIALIAGGAVTQSGALTIGGYADVSATGFDITLANAANSFGSTVGFDGANVSLRDSTALAVAISIATGDLTLQSDGAITQTGPLTVTGDTTATTTGDITLNNAGNAFTGTVGGSGANIAITDSTPLSLAATTASGTLTAVSNGAITQTGALSTGGLASFTAGTANDITLTTAGNAMASVGIVSGNNVSITEADGIALATSAVTGNLTLDAKGGAISQSGTLSVGGTSSLTATGDINLAGSSAFTGDVTFNGGANVSINDIKSNLNIGAGSSATGNLAITSAGVITDGGSLTVGGNAAFTGTSATLDGLAVTGTVGVNVTGNATLVNATALALAASSVGGNLAATATTGNLTDSGTVTISGNAAFTTSASGADISLDQTTVVGSVQFNTTGATGNASFTTTGGVNLNGGTIGGDLTLGTTGNIIQSAALSVGGAATLGTIGDINLNNAGNDFNSVGISGARNVGITDANSVALNASTVSGTLGVTALAGSITDNGALAVTGASTFAAATGITLDAANNFSSVNASTTAGDVVLNDTGDLVLAGVNANTGLASIKADGAVTQTGAITAGSLELIGGGSFTLTNTGNNVANLAANTTGAVSYTDSNALSIGNTAGATTGITTAGAVTVSTLAGSLTLTATGDIVAGGDVNLMGAGGISTAGDVTTTGDLVRYQSATTLTGDVAISTSGGDVIFNSTLSGTTAGAEDLSITAGAGDVTLAGAVGATALGAITINSAADVTVSGAITAASFTQTAGTGLTTLGGTLTATTGSVAVTNEVINLNGGIDTTGGNGTVTLNATVGVLSIAAVGDIISGGMVSLSGQGGISTGGDVITTGDTVAYNNDVTLAGNVSVNTTSGGNTGGAAITFGGSINADNAAANNRTLTLNAGANGALVQGDIGNLQPLAGLTVTNAEAATFNSDVYVNDGTGIVNFVNTSKSVTFNGSLIAGKLLTGFSSFDLYLYGSNNVLSGGPTTLSNTGIVQLGDNDTDVSLFTGGLTVTSANPNTKVAGIIRTASSPITLQRTSLVANTTLDTTNNGASTTGAAITLADGVTFNGFTLETIGGTKGGTSLTGSVTLDPGSLVVDSGNLAIGDGTTVTTVTITGDESLVVTTGTLIVNANSTIDAGANNLTLQANSMSILSGTGSIIAGTVTVTPITLSRPIYIGGAATGQANSLQLNQVAMNAFATGLLTIGQDGDTGTVTIGTLAIDDALKIIANGGGAKVVVNGGGITSSYTGANPGFEIVGSGSTTVLSSNIITSGTSVIIDDAVQVNAATITIDTTSGGATGADVSITGGVSGIFATKGASNDLVVTAGTGNVVLGSLRGFGNGGTGSLLTNLTVDGATISLPTASTVNGFVFLGTNSPASSITLGETLASGNPAGIIMSATDITLGGNVTAGATLTINGAVALGSTVTLAGDGISVTGSIDAAGNDLTLDGRSGTVGTAGAVTVTGNITDAANLSLIDAANATFGSAVTGAVSAQSLQISSTNTGTVQFSNTLTVAGQVSAAGGTYALAIIGTGNVIGGPVSFLNTGILTIGDGDFDTTEIQSGVSRNLATHLQGSVSFGGSTTLGSVNASTDGGELNLTADSLNFGYNNGGNKFGGLSFTTAGATTFTAGALAVTTLLTVNAGSIGQTGTGTLAPTGTTSLTATGTIALGGANNFGGTVEFHGVNVTINDITELSLDNLSPFSPNTATGNLVLSSANGISQKVGSSVSVTGFTTLTSTGQDISLDQAGNTFTGPVGFTGANVALGATGALALAASTATGTLGVTTTGALSQTGVLNITGATTLSATDISLGLANAFTGDVKFNGANVTLNDTANGLAIATGSSASGNLALSATGDITDAGTLLVTGNASFTTPANATLDGLSVGGTIAVNTGNNATLVDNLGGLELAASTVGGNLNVTAATGVLSDIGTVSVSGNAIFSATQPNAGIVLDQISVAGTIQLNTTGTTGNAAVTSARPLYFDGSTVNGTLTVTTPGNITQTGAAFTVTGATSLSGAVINLGEAKNDFQGPVNFTGSNVTLRDTNALALAASSATGNVFIQAEGISQTGALSVIGTTGLTVGAGDLVLGDANNSFTGPVTLSVNSNATLAAKNALVFDTSAVNGNLTIDSIGVDQVLNKYIIVNGETDIDVTANGDISLDNATNNFGTLFSFNARNVAVTDLNDINFGNGTAAGTLGVVANGNVTQSPATALVISGNATVTSTTGDITLANAGNSFGGTIGFAGNDVDINDSTPMVLAESSATGNLNLTNATSITQTGKLTVGGDTTASVTAGDIILNNAGNAFAGSVALSAVNGAVTDSTPLLFGTTTLTGTLAAISKGDITQNGPIDVTGATTLTATGFDVTLNDPNNDFSSIGFGGANDVAITDKSGISLDGGAITGNLAINATGDITDNGPLTVAGSATFNAGAAGDVILNASNDFNSVGVTLANNVVVNDINALAFDNSTIQGTLDVTTSGQITGPGALVVAGAATFSAGQANNITLTNPGNDFNSVGITTGNNVAVTDSNNIILAQSTVSGTLGVTAGGTVTDMGALVVSGAATINAQGDVTLSDPGNDFSSIGVNSPGGVVINDINALVLNASSIGGTLGVTTDGAITDSGPLAVTGAATFEAGSANDITLDAGNDFSSVGITSGRNVTLNDINDLVMAMSSISGTLGVTAGGSITGNAPLVVADAASFVSLAAGDVSLTGNNDFSSVGVNGATDVTLNDINDINLTASSMTGDLAVSALGAITDSGSVSAAGTAAFTSTGAGDITLDQLNIVGLITADTVDGNATLVNAVATSFGGSVGGLFSVRAVTGGITDGAPILTDNGLVLEAPGASTLTQALSGIGGLTFNGTGTLTVAGINTYTGDTVITAGVLSLSGSLATSHVRVQGGTLRGNGDLGNLTSTAGTVRPGNSPGQFATTGSATIGAGSTYTVEIDGLTPATGYSQLVVGGVTLGGVLNLVTSNPSFNPQIGTRFTIIDNTGPNRVSGTFAGLAEGSTVYLGKQSYTITYKGGTGANDVQLIRTNVIPTPPGPVVTQPFSLNPGVIVSSTNGTPAQVQLSTVSGGVNGGVTRRIVPFRGYTGLISVNALDRTGDGVADSLLVSKASPGNLSTVMVIDAATGRTALQFNAFGNTFAGGARVTSGLTTINGVTRTVIAVAAGPGSTPTVKVYDAITGALVKSFNAFSTNYKSGIDVAMTSETATQPGVLTVVSLVNSYVRVFNLNNTASPLASFQAFTQQPMPANSIAVGDINGDGFNEIIVGVGNLNLPAVRVFSMTGQRLAQFTPYPLEYTGGVTVGVTDYDRDGQLDIVTVAQSVARGRVRIFHATGSPVLGNFRLASVLTLATAGSNATIEVQQPT